MPAGPIDLVQRVVSALDSLGVGYLVGGSLASSVHGFARTTNDVDLVADLKLQDVQTLVAALQDEFYAEPSVIADAIIRRGSFNLIHFDTAFKVDVFVLGDDAFALSAFRRRRPEPVDGVVLFFATPEDTLLAKLQGYRDGGGVSERQWADVMGIAKVQGERLDLSYLREWAARLGIMDLFEGAPCAAAP